MYAKVIVDISNSEVDRVFDYSLSFDVKKGQRVRVPFGGRNVEGYVIGLSETSDCPADKIKHVERVLDSKPVISEEMFELMWFMTERYHLRVVDALRLFIPAQMRGGRVKELTRLFAYVNPEYIGRNPDEFIKPSALAQRELFDYLKSAATREKQIEQDSGHIKSGKISKEINLNTNKAGEKEIITNIGKAGEFVNIITSRFSAAAYKNLVTRGIILTESRKVARTPYKSLQQEQSWPTLTDEQVYAVKTINAKAQTFLLHGVTGSGKTEVYIRCIDEVLKNGKTAIMLVPEISLTPQMFSRFKARFGDSIAILHSGLSAGERFDEWQRLLSGEALVAIGARSAVFAPLKNIGVIIIDEEHDQSYNSESNPRYITSEVAMFRQRYNDCTLVLGSATPSVETYYLAQKGGYKLIEMNRRINNTLPAIKVINMANELYAGNNSLFSAELYSRLRECLEQKNQAMLFINRRGYSSFVRCTACGYVAMCERCDVSLVYHKDESVLKCHYCGNRYATPGACPKCGSAHLRRGYVGTQQVEEKLLEQFPKARILRMDNDTTQTKDAHVRILSDFKERKADILIGTQMIAKGHDFPLVTLVGIIDADISLHFSDYKSNERTFQLITQVAGRAGRADKPGSVILQTYSPNHYVYRFAVQNDYSGFFKKEINLREVTAFPPFGQILRILASGENEQDTAQVLKDIYDGMLELSRAYRPAFAFLSYMRSPVKRIMGRHRMQVLCRITQSFDEILKKVYTLTDTAHRKGVSVFVEINPNNLS